MEKEQERRKYTSSTKSKYNQLSLPFENYNNYNQFPNIRTTQPQTQSNLAQSKSQKKTNINYELPDYSDIGSRYMSYSTSQKYNDTLNFNIKNFQGNFSKYYCKRNKDKDTYKDKDMIRQVYNKKKFIVSNELDNYFYPKYHSRSWWPNGQYIVKQRYKHSESGLEHIYERGNVEEKLIVGDEIEIKKGRIIKNVKKKKRVDLEKEFIELKEIKPGDFVIIIEYCSSCEEHSNITQHLTDTIFKDLALKYQRIIYERFPFIKVFLKPIDVDIVKSTVFKMPKQPNGGPYEPCPSINSQFKECRIGAFEIKISSIKKKLEKNNLNQLTEVIGPEVKIIHSKLEKKTFPNVNKILDTIYYYLPTFRLKLVLFDKEDYQELDKMNGILVNIYFCKSDIVKELSESIKEQVESFTSPKKRFEMLNAQRLMQKQNPFKIKETFFGNGSFSNRISSAYPGKKRELSASRMLSSRPITGGFARTTSSCTQFSNEKDNITKEEKITEELLKSQIGTLADHDYSKVNQIDDKDNSESVTILFKPLRYDTYIIETVENCNFQSSWTLLKFNQINPSSMGEVTKYIGLWHQRNAILNIHLYRERENVASLEENGKKKKQSESQNPQIVKTQEQQEIEISQNQQQIAKSQNPKTISFILVTTANINISTLDDPNSKYKVYPNKKGIYEYMTKPGEYKIEIINEDCERVVEKIKIVSGLNKKVVKLNDAKQCHLIIQVLEYSENNYKDKFQQSKSSQSKFNYNDVKTNIRTEPVRNAEIQIFKNSTDLIKEGITNRKGIMLYDVDKNENNLSIKVNKHGYFRAERFFKRSSTMKKDEKGDYVCEMTFILVKKELLEDCKKILFVAYTNKCKNIFDLIIEKEENKEKPEEELNHYEIKNMQLESGIFISSVWQKLQKREEDELILDEHFQSNSAVKQKTSIRKEPEEIIENEENKPEFTEEDFNENTNFEEIVRIGLKVSPSITYDEEEDNDDENKDVKAKDLIEYLRDICCEANIYTPKYDYHINLPKVIMLEKQITELNPGSSVQNNTIANKSQNNIYTQSNIYNNADSSKVTENKKQQTENKQNKIITGLYWDLGWLDLKNYYYYETSVYFPIEYRPERLIFFVKFLEFLQILIDQKLCDNLFKFFSFDNSVLAGSDRYLPKKTFYNIIYRMLPDENENENIEDEELIEQRKQAINDKENFIEFICNILCGYDEEMNIRDDAISFNLLRKKISSNLKNFNGEDIKQFGK